MLPGWEAAALLLSGVSLSPFFSRYISQPFLQEPSCSEMAATVGGGVEERSGIVCGSGMSDSC